MTLKHCYHLLHVWTMQFKGVKGSVLDRVPVCNGSPQCWKKQGEISELLILEDKSRYPHRRDTLMEQAAQSCNQWLLCVLSGTRTRQQHKKQLLSCSSLVTGILLCLGCFSALGHCEWHCCISAGCQVSDLQERGGEIPRQDKLLLSNFRVPVSIAAALCDSKDWKTWAPSTSLLRSFRLWNLLQVGKT